MEDLSRIGTVVEFALHVATETIFRCDRCRLTQNSVRRCLNRLHVSFLVVCEFARFGTLFATFLRTTACNAWRVLAIVEASVSLFVRPSVRLSHSRAIKSSYDDSFYHNLVILNQDFCRVI